MSPAMRIASLSSLIRPSLPGTHGTLALRATALALFLSPSFRIASGEKAKALRTMTLPIGQGIAGTVIASACRQVAPAHATSALS